MIPAFFSDHSVVQIRVGIKTHKNIKPQSWSFSKMNERLFENDDFKRGVESALDIECSKEGECQKWETFNLHIRKMAIEMPSTAGYHEKIQENYLINDILYLYRLECQEPGKHKNEILHLRKQIEEHDIMRYGIAAVRTRTLKMIEGK